MAKKTLLDIIKIVASELNLPQPTTVVSASDQKILKLLAFARAVNDDLLAEFNWQALNTRYSFATVANQEAYAFPTDIERWLNGSFFNSATRWPLVGPLSASEWEWSLFNFTTGGPSIRYRVFGDKMHILPIPIDANSTFSFEYISNYTVLNGNTGAPQADYTQDSDICRFDHRMVVYGIKLKHLQSIDLDTTSALVDYRRAIEFQKGKDVPGRTLSLFGSQGAPFITTANYPDGSWT